MYIPGLSTSNRKLIKRKGSSGGKGGGSSGGSEGGSSGSSGDGTSSTGSKGSTGSSGSTSGGTSSVGSQKSVPLSGSVAGGRSSAVAYGTGTTKQITIPSGQIFAGRTAGGASRTQIYGNSRYGSGYPGVNGLGVASRGFPFFFWPVVYGGVIGGTVGGYLHDGEYGDANNSSRPGGPLVQAPFQSSSSNNTFHIVSDNSTVLSLISSINANCSSFLSSSSNTTQPQSYNSSLPSSPQPEQAVQYYRASSIVLTEDGYNNSATFSNDSNAPNSPLPNFTDTVLLNCLNQTIGEAAPLIDGASNLLVFDHHSRIGIGGVCVIWVLWMISTII